MSDPTWLIAAADQRLALLKEAMATGTLPESDVIMMLLTEPPENATPAQWAEWELACDNCRRVPPKGLYTGSIQVEVDKIKVVITFGCCKKCADLT